MRDAMSIYGADTARWNDGKRILEDTIKDQEQVILNSREAIKSKDGWQSSRVVTLLIPHQPSQMNWNARGSQTDRYRANWNLSRLF